MESYHSRYSKTSAGKENNILIRVEQGHSQGFYAFNNYDEVDDFVQVCRMHSRNYNFCLHEVTQNCPQKFKVDIDSKDTEIQWESILVQIREAIEEVFYVSFNVRCSPILFRSERPYGGKLSAHYVVDEVYFNSHLECMDICAIVCSKLPPEVSMYIDTAVYKKFQSFRMENFSKPGQGRFKRYVQGGEPYQRFKGYIGYVEDSEYVHHTLSGTVVPANQNFS